MSTTNNNQTNGLSTALSVIAIVVSIAALIIGWTAFNRTGEDLSDVIRMEVETAVDDAAESIENATEAARDESAEALRDTADDVDPDTE